MCRGEETLQICHPLQSYLDLPFLFIVFVFASSFSESPDELPDYPLFISIGDWLDSIKMCQYKNNFLAAGYTTLDSISTMSIE